MKLFNSNRYTKEGKGIEKDKPEKKPFFKFWEIVWLKRFKLIALNFMYFIPNLIAAALAGLSYFTATSLFYTLSNQKTIAESAEAAENTATILGTEFGTELFTKTLLFIVIFFTVLPIFAAGPFQSGMTYILRCFTKREPCFLWTDYTSKTRSNLKLSIQASVINAIAGFFIILDFAVYFALSSTTSAAKGVFPNWMLTLSLIVLIFLTVLFLVMSMYIYPMIVTFRLTLKQLYKNAMLFAFIKWLPNIGIVLLDAALVFLPLFFINGAWSLYISLFLYAAVGITFIGFINISYTYPVIKKCLIDNYKTDKSQTEPEKQEEEI
ncbi:MAG: hypothetical protein ACLSVG_10755 [Clostridia bacterium]